MYYETKRNDLVIRDAEVSDLDQILSLIKSIAKYEKMDADVVATKEILHKSIFVDKRANVLLAYYKGEIAGYLVYFYNFSTFIGKEGIFIEDIFVFEEYRRLHIGETLFKTIAKIAFMDDIKRIDWCCLDWNVPSLAFYKRMGGIVKDEWVYHRMEQDTIEYLAK